MMTSDKPIVKNVKACGLCKGRVDRYEHVFVCSNCGAVGDLFTGIMMHISRRDPIGESQTWMDGL